MKSLKGHFLVAVPDLADTNFFRTVVLMIQHDEEGATGLVLNRPSNVQLEDIWSEISDSPLSRQMPINIGGPVQGPLMAIHDFQIFAENEVIPEIYLSLQRENIDQLVGNDQVELRLFSGYSGWAPGQLEAELDAGGWFTTEAHSDQVFMNADELWQTICERIGNEIMFQDIQPTLIPNDPSSN